jgi:CRISPR-associated protein Csb2
MSDTQLEFHLPAPPTRGNTSLIPARLTPYCMTRHAKLGDAAAAVENDLLAECRRCGLPRPQVKIERAVGKPGIGLFGHATLSFHHAVCGPLLLGRDRHFGGGLFAAVD